MDKQKTITIKINGEDHSHKTGKLKRDEQTGSEDKTKRTPKVTTWTEIAAAQESADDDFDWILPDPADPGEKEVVKEFKHTDKPKTGKLSGFRLPAINKIGNNSRNIPRVILNIVLAIIVGTGFGLIILQTVKEEPTVQLQPSQTTPADPTDPTDPTDATTPTDGTEIAEIPSISAFVVQGGVYSTAKSAQTVVKTLEEKGILAQSVAMNGKFSILLGTTSSLEEAKALGNELEAKGAEVIAQPVEFAGGSIPGLTIEEQKVLSIAPELFQAFSNGTGADTDTLSKVETQLAELKKIKADSLSNGKINAVKTHLEQGASAFLANESINLQKETLAFLTAWQAIGK